MEKKQRRCYTEELGGMAEGLAEDTVRHGHGSIGWMKVSRWLERQTMVRWVALYEIKNKLIFFLQDMQHVDDLTRLFVFQNRAGVREQR